MTEDLERAIVAKVQRGDVRVPAYPPSANKLQRVLGQADFTMADVIKVLRTDDVLAATTLRLANSAFYSRGETTSTLSNAVLRIGSQQLHRLSVAAGTQRVFSTPGPLSPLRRRVWRQSLMSAAICETLAQLSGENAEESFVAGLLHDIGRVLAISVLEELSCTDEEIASRMIERFHVELGMVIAARWMLPPSIEEVIADHHVRDAGSEEPFLRRVQASDMVVALLEVEPTVTAERLGAVGLLTTRECRELATRIPQMPEFVEAFGINDIVDRAPLAVVAGAKADPAPALEPGGSGIEVEISSAGPTPVRAELVRGTSTEIHVRARTPGKTNWLVQVKVQGLSFWANVRGSVEAKGAYDWELKPFALSPEVAEKWAAVTAGLRKAA